MVYWGLQGEYLSICIHWNSECISQSLAVWKLCHSCILVFAADDTIPISCFDLPGSTYDSTAINSRFIYKMLENVYQEAGLRGTNDSAFRCKVTLYLLNSMQHD